MFIPATITLAIVLSAVIIFMALRLSRFSPALRPVPSSAPLRPGAAERAAWQQHQDTLPAFPALAVPGARPAPRRKLADLYDELSRESSLPRTGARARLEPPAPPVMVLSGRARPAARTQWKPEVQPEDGPLYAASVAAWRSARPPEVAGVPPWRLLDHVPAPPVPPERKKPEFPARVSPPAPASSPARPWGTPSFLNPPDVTARAAAALRSLRDIPAQEEEQDSPWLRAQLAGIEGWASSTIAA
jgi:hypothetical protein